MIKILFEKVTIYEKTSLIIKESINKILVEKDEVILGLPGGRNVSKIFQLLKKERIDWKKVHVFMVDERLVPTDSQDRNFRLIKQDLSEVILDKNFHPFIFNENKHDYCLDDYEKEIKNFGGRYDIVLLSSGEDGHIGSIFPNHPSFFDESEYYILVDNSPKLPRKRMSISKKFLLKSKIGILLFVGDIKRRAYLKFLDKDVTTTMCPAKLVIELPESYVITNIESQEN